MSSAKTTADLFRERGWGVGTPENPTLVTSPGTLRQTPWQVLAVGNDCVFMRAVDGYECVFSQRLDWSLYRPTPPVPTEEEWREKVWAKLKAWRKSITHHHSAYPAPVKDLILLVDEMMSRAGDQ